MTKLIHREIILAKLEVTYGTDPVPTAAANAVLVQALSWSHAGLRMEKRPAIRVSNAPIQDVYGGSLRTVTFQCDLKGSGAAGTAPEFDALLQSCGMASTVVASTSVTYAPISTPASQVSCTIYYYEDGSLCKITGVRGAYEIDLKAGAVGKIKFTMTGHWAAVTDVALPTPTYITTVPPALLNVPATLGAYSPVLETLNIKSGVKVEMPPSMGATDGYGQIFISARAITGTMDPQADTVANFADIADMTAGTTIALTTGVMGSAAGNKIDISCPAIFFTDVKPGNRNGIRTHSINFNALENGGTQDNDISIAFT